MNDDNSEMQSLDDASVGAPDGLETPEGEFIAPEQPPANRSMMILVGVALIGAAALYFVYGRTGPASASAASVAETEAAHETVDNFLSDGDASIRKMQKMLAETEKIVRQFLAYPSVRQIPLSDLRTNPFRHVTLKPAVKDDDEDVKKKREQERAAIVKAVQSLSLQSVVHSGSHKACMINNALYNEGQQVDQFMIEKINPNSIIVRSGAYRFELKMQH
ncbi:MAG TPA: hypothetical protein VIL86_05140 [Tepidisphaeraceae bacterium]|jgi:hypothetical protein